MCSELWPRELMFVVSRCCIFTDSLCSNRKLIFSLQISICFSVKLPTSELLQWLSWWSYFFHIFHNYFFKFIFLFLFIHLFIYFVWHQLLNFFCVCGHQLLFIYLFIYLFIHLFIFKVPLQKSCPIWFPKWSLSIFLMAGTRTQRQIRNEHPKRPQREIIQVVE